MESNMPNLTIKMDEAIISFKYPEKSNATYYKIKKIDALEIEKIIIEKANKLTEIISLDTNNIGEIPQSNVITENTPNEQIKDTNNCQTAYPNVILRKSNDICAPEVNTKPRTRNLELGLISRSNETNAFKNSSIVEIGQSNVNIKNTPKEQIENNNIRQTVNPNIIPKERIVSCSTEIRPKPRINRGNTFPKSSNEVAELLKITVQLDNRKIILNVSEGTSVENFKVKVKEAFQIDNDRFQLFCNGNLMMDKQLLDKSNNDGGEFIVKTKSIVNEKRKNFLNLDNTFPKPSNSVAELLKITVKLDNRKIILNVPVGTSVENFKVKVKEAFKIDNFQLFCHGDLMKDNQLLNKSNIGNGEIMVQTILNVKKKRESYLNISGNSETDVLKVTVTFGNEIKTFEVPEGMTIAEFKAKVKRSLDIENNQIRLFYKNTEMENNKSINHYISGEEEMILVAIKISVIVKFTFENKSFNFDVFTNMKLSDFIEQLCVKAKIEGGKVALNFQGEIMEGNKTLLEYEITDGATILCTVKLIGGNYL